MLQIKRWTVLVPLLVASLPVIFFAAKNSEEVTVLQVASVLAVVLVATLLITLPLRFFIKDSSKVAAIVIILLVIFFSFGHIHDLIKGATIASFPIGRLRYLMLLTSIGGFGGIWAVFRYKGNLTKPIQYFAVVV